MRFILHVRLFTRLYLGYVCRHFKELLLAYRFHVVHKFAYTDESCDFVYILLTLKCRVSALSIALLYLLQTS